MHIISLKWKTNDISYCCCRNMFSFKNIYTLGQYYFYQILMCEIVHNPSESSESVLNLGSNKVVAASTLTSSSLSDLL